MLHTKSQGHCSFGSREDDTFRGFKIYGRGGHLGHVTRTICIDFGQLIIRSLRMKFEFNWLSGFLRILYFYMLMGLQYERPWLIGQRSTLTFETYL